MGVQRRARAPALHCGRDRAATHKRQPPAGPAGGPMQRGGGRSARETTRRRDTVCRPRFRHPFALHCRAGVHARRGGLAPAQKDTRKARRRTCSVSLYPPQAALDSAAPYRGSFIGGSPPKASPARGGGCAARRRRRGALPPCPTGILQNPAGPCPASVGDDACIVPEPPATHRKPQAAGEIARPTLRPGASGNRYASANRQARRRADEIIGPYAGGVTHIQVFDYVIPATSFPA